MKIFSAAAATILLFAFAATAETTNGLSDAEIQGRQLAQKICDARPAEGLTNTGVLEIRDGKGNRTNYPIHFVVTIEDTNWTCLYDATLKPKPGYPTFGYALLITHSEGVPNNYRSFVDHLWADCSNSETMFPFRHSDFWICDLGLEFFHWPEQKILKRENRRGRACNVLESTNPNPSTNGYSRVVTWIDDESLGIVFAEAYDASGKKLKEFEPKSFKKVNGQWELKDMEIRNVQTRSRTRIEFDLKK